MGSSLGTGAITECVCHALHRTVGACTPCSDRKAAPEPCRQKLYSLCCQQFNSSTVSLLALKTVADRYKYCLLKVKAALRGKTWNIEVNKELAMGTVQRLTCCFCAMWLQSLAASCPSLQAALSMLLHLPCWTIPEGSPAPVVIGTHALVRKQNSQRGKKELMLGRVAATC